MTRADRNRLFGIDFSGAKDAGDRIWISRCSVADEGLHIERCAPARDLPGSGTERDRCLEALRTLIAGAGEATFGLDFPFSLPRNLINYHSWESFVLAFPNEYASPEAFRQACREATPGRELKRKTDREAKAPFAPYNIRLYRQTYYGIRRLLAPLVEMDQARLLPMQEPAEGKPLVLEVCPASTLKEENLYLSYKGSPECCLRARQRILQGLEQKEVKIESTELRLTVVGDAGGDALDSVVAAVATFRAQQDPAFPSSERRDDDAYAAEGYIYV
jgi:hypothetical protein